MYFDLTHKTHITPYVYLQAEMLGLSGPIHFMDGMRQDVRFQIVKLLHSGNLYLSQFQYSLFKNNICKTVTLFKSYVE